MNLLLTGAFNYSNEQLKKIERLGYKITYVKEERKKIDIDVSTFDVVVCNSLFLYNDIKKFENLKMIQLTSAGLDRVPIEYIQEKNIKLFNARGVYSVPIAEWTILKVLEVYKKSNVFMEQQRNKEWTKQKELRELTNKNIAILGYGGIGNEIAKRFNAFGTNIYAFDIFEPETNYHHKYLNIEKLDEHIGNMDIIILTMPLNKDTKHFMDYHRLKLIKNNSVIVNVSRGEIFIENDLIKHLKKNKDIYAILDVFKEEPLKKENKLWSLKNVIISPHNSYESTENNQRMFSTIYSNLSIGEDRDV